MITLIKRCYYCGEEAVEMVEGYHPDIDGITASYVCHNCQAQIDIYVPLEVYIPLEEE